MAQMDEYKKNGFPVHYGLFENSILVRKHDDQFCKGIDDCLVGGIQ